ncbi:MAG: diacylglycerol kinase family protein [Bacteroidales bacterium]|nr:diacylglycerol kinase family protein [Bacteroidales bacterium]
MNSKQQKFSIKKRLKSFTYAFNGLWVIVKEEHNFRIHLFAALFVVVAGFFFSLTVLEWCVVIFAIGFVFSLEIINSAIENISDFVSPDRNVAIKKIKDISAAAVLVGAFTALIIGFLIFIPKIVALISILDN